MQCSPSHLWAFLTIRKALPSIKGKISSLQMMSMALMGPHGTSDTKDRFPFLQEVIVPSCVIASPH